MARRARVGIAALLDVTQARDKLNAFTCGYALGPRINAGGRISEADLGVRLLLCDDRVEALALAEKLDSVNRQRQEVEAGIMDAAMRSAEAQVAAGQAVVVVRSDMTSEASLRDAVGLLSGCEDIKLLLNAAHFSPSGRRFGTYYGYKE